MGATSVMAATQAAVTGARIFMSIAPCGRIVRRGLLDVVKLGTGRRACAAGLRASGLVPAAGLDDRGSAGLRAGLPADDRALGGRSARSAAGQHAASAGFRARVSGLGPRRVFAQLAGALAAPVGTPDFVALVVDLHTFAGHPG